jgi:uncharacterized protein YbjT (DUF2867 family)
MELLVFGASGKTGRQVVEQALSRQHVVRAFVRQPTKLPLVHPNLSTVRGDIEDATAIQAALAGQPTVISCLGAPSPVRRYPAFTAGIQCILAALRETPGTRFIYQSFLGVPGGRHQLRFPFKQLVQIVLRGAIADHAANEAQIRASGLAWTIVRAPKLTTGPARAHYRTGEHIQATNRFPTMPRSDVAAFMLDEAERNEFVTRAPAILP